MAHERQVYLLDPQTLTPEAIAVTFAKTSRSPESFRQIATELTEQKSAEFNEKWVVGYGHSSVAEHAVLHIAVENVSRLAAECIESNRLASYTEKSTRYQTWSPDAYFIPNEWKNSPLSMEYLAANTCFFDAYTTFLPRVITAASVQYPQLEQESGSAYQRRMRSLAVDVCRYLLPASSLANIGITINARALEHALSKLLSHPLVEARQIGQEIKTAAQEIVPTLLKYAEPTPYLTDMEALFSGIPGVSPAKDDSWFRLLSFDADAVNQLLAGVYYRYSGNPALNYPQALQTVEKMDAQAKNALLCPLLSERERHTPPLRELEHIQFKFEATLDQGAYYEVKRHRMMTLTPRPLTTCLGFATPQLIEEAGLAVDYQAVMKTASDTYAKLAQVNPQAAAYIVPNAFNRRFLISINLRSAIHFIALRSAPKAHFAIRRLALKMADEIEQAIPEIKPLLPKGQEESVHSIEQQFFSQLA